MDSSHGSHTAGSKSFSRHANAASKEKVKGGGLVSPMITCFLLFSFGVGGGCWGLCRVRPLSPLSLLSRPDEHFPGPRPARPAPRPIPAAAQMARATPPDGVRLVRLGPPCVAALCSDPNRTNTQFKFVRPDDDEAVIVKYGLSMAGSRGAGHSPTKRQEHVQCSRGLVRRPSAPPPLRTPWIGSTDGWAVAQP